MFCNFGFFWDLKSSVVTFCNFCNFLFVLVGARRLFHKNRSLLEIPCKTIAIHRQHVRAWGDAQGIWKYFDKKLHQTPKPYRLHRNSNVCRSRGREVCLEVWRSGEWRFVASWVLEVCWRFGGLKVWRFGGLKAWRFGRITNVEPRTELV